MMLRNKKLPPQPVKGMLEAEVKPVTTAAAESILLLIQVCSLTSDTELSLTTLQYMLQAILLRAAVCSQPRSSLQQ